MSRASGRTVGRHGIEAGAIDQPRRKAATTVAAAIEREIITGRYALGAPLGTEAELCLRYGVSRWALREAIAIVQHDGLVLVRRGRGGGAVVNAAPERSLAAAICGFLLYAQIGNAQLIDARVTIDRLLYDLAVRESGRPLPPGVAALLDADVAGLDAVAYSSAVLDEILTMSGNPFVTVFGLALSKLTMCRLALVDRDGGTTSDAELADQLARLRRRQLRSIVGLDAKGIAATMIDMARSWRILFDRFGDPSPQPFSPVRARAQARRIAAVLQPDGDVRAAGTVSALLMLDILNGRVGTNGALGSEAALIGRYGVARNTLREGIRILERDGLVRAESGRTGGIRAGTPDTSVLVERAAHIFAFLRLRTRDMDLLARDLRMAAIELVTKDDTARPALAAEIATMADAAAPPHPAADLFLSIVERTGDAFLILFERLCARLTTPLGGGDCDKDLLQDLAAAVTGGRTVLARRAVAMLHRGWMAGLPENIS